LDSAKQPTYAVVASSSPKPAKKGSLNASAQPYKQLLQPRKEWHTLDHSLLVSDCNLQEDDDDEHIFFYKGWYAVHDTDAVKDKFPFTLAEVPDEYWLKMIAWSDQVRAGGCQAHGLCQRNLRKLLESRKNATAPDVNSK